MLDTEPGNRITKQERAWAILRLILGIMQMGGAVAAVTLWATTGPNSMSIGMAVLTCLLTALSRYWFHNRTE
jgi:nicotinamide riboside transporter PnuC